MSTNKEQEHTLNILERYFDSPFYILDNQIIQSECKRFKFTIDGTVTKAQYVIENKQYNFEYFLMPLTEIEKDFKKIFQKIALNYDYSETLSKLKEVFKTDFEVEVYEDSIEYMSNDNMIYVIEFISTSKRFTIYFDQQNIHGLHEYFNGEGLDYCISEFMRILQDVNWKAQDLFNDTKKYLDVKLIN